MNTLAVEKLIYQHFLPAATHQGFEGSRQGFPFVRKIEAGRQSILLSVVDYDPYYRISFLVTWRLDAIDDIVNAIMGASPKYWSQSYSLVVGSEYFTGTRLEFEVTSGNEIVDAMEQVLNMFHNSFFPLLNHNLTVIDVERLVNRSEREFRQTVNHLAAVGVVSAALCKCGDFAALVERYRRNLVNYVEPVKNAFEKVVAHASAMR